MTVNRERCEKCDVKIPKYQPILVCDLCSISKHLACQNLKKSDALLINHLGISWSCRECISQALPINLVRRKFSEDTNKTKFKIKCNSCSGFSFSQRTTKTCQWCDGQVHAKCRKGDL